MSSSPKKKAELLTSRYVRDNSLKLIPMDITYMIQLFYDQYFYWKLQKDEMTQFHKAKFKDIIHSPSTFTIQGIEFECTLAPNGWREASEGYVEMFIEIKNMPSNIDYFLFYGEIGCDFTLTNRKFVRRFKSARNVSGARMGKLIDFQDTQHIEFYCMVDIFAVKYKKTMHKLDYKLPLRLIKHIEYEWKIDDKLQLERIKNLQIMNHGLYSDKFGGDNWCIALHPKGFSRFNKGDFEIRLFLLRWSLGIVGMTVRYIIEMEYASGRIYGGNVQGSRLKYNDGKNTIVIKPKMKITCGDVDVDELFEEEWIKVCVEIEILYILLALQNLLIQII